MNEIADGPLSAPPEETSLTHSIEHVHPEKQAAEAPVTEAPVLEIPVPDAPVSDAPVAETPTPETPVVEAPVDPGRARAQEKWDRLVAAKAAGEIVTGRVKTAVKGGLIVAIDDFRAFLPASQTQLEKDAPMESLVKATIPLKIIDVDEKRRRFVVSHRKALESQRKAGREEFLATLTVGEEREVTVARLTDFGAFVELGFGVDALIPMSELAIERVNRAEDVLKPGEVLKVRVLRVEQRGKRISVSRKALLSDPWREHTGNLRVGSTLTGTVVAIDDRLTVEIAPGITGTLSDRDANPDDYTIGESIEVTIRSLDPRTRRVRLGTPHSAAANIATTSTGFAPLGIELKR